MGNRFRGGIEPGAMPLAAPLPRQPGADAASAGCSSAARSATSTAACAASARTRSATLDLQTHRAWSSPARWSSRRRSTGCASPRCRRRCRRTAASRPPHLRTWRDGWRHLRFLLLFSPRWLFLYPGLLLLGAAWPGSWPCFRRTEGRQQRAGHPHVRCLLHARADRYPGRHVRRDRAPLHHEFVACCRRRRATHRCSRHSTPERMLVAGLVIFLVALVGLIWSLWQWIAADFGPLTDDRIPARAHPRLHRHCRGRPTMAGGFPLASLMEINQKP